MQLSLQLSKLQGTTSYFDGNMGRVGVKSDTVLHGWVAHIGFVVILFNQSADTSVISFKISTLLTNAVSDLTRLVKQNVRNDDSTITGEEPSNANDNEEPPTETNTTKVTEEKSKLPTKETNKNEEIQKEILEDKLPIQQHQNQVRGTRQLPEFRGSCQSKRHLPPIPLTPNTPLNHTSFT